MPRGDEVVGCVVCPSCSRESRPSDHYCEKCGTALAFKFAAPSPEQPPTALATRCTRCQAALEVADRFCISCGTPVLPAVQGRSFTNVHILILLLLAAVAGAVIALLNRPKGESSPQTTQLAITSRVVAVSSSGQPSTTARSTTTASTPLTAPRSTTTLRPPTTAGRTTTLRPPTTGTPTTAPARPATVAVVPVTVTSSCQSDASEDGAGNVVSYEPTNVTDGAGETAWRCGGDATGQSIRLTLTQPTTIISAGVVPGYDKVDPARGIDRFPEMRRVASVRWSCIDPSGSVVAVARQDLADDRRMQTRHVHRL